MGEFYNVLRCAEQRWITLLVFNLGYFVILGLFCFEWVNCSNMNPLHPDISLYILHTVLNTFPKVQIKRICSIIKSLFSW